MRLLEIYLDEIFLVQNMHASKAAPTYIVVVRAVPGFLEKLGSEFPGDVVVLRVTWHLVNAVRYVLYTCRDTYLQQYRHIVY